jgi:hypothetical protein
MGYTINDITQGDLTGVGVIGLPDTPNLSASAMQSKFEETRRSVIIPKLNEVIDELDNNGMTRTEINQTIEDRIAYVGGGDMAKAVYDTDNDGVVDNAALLDGHAASEFITTANTLNVFFRGSNPITSTANDTTANWKALGNGAWYYSTANCLNDQPSQWGMVYSIVNDAGNVYQIAQIWINVPTAKMYIRSGNASGWGATWSQLFNGSVSRDNVAGIVKSNTSTSKTLTMSLSGSTLTITYR